MEFKTLTQYASGTTVHYFSNGLLGNPDFSTYEIYPAYIAINSIGEPVNLSSVNDRRISVHDGVSDSYGVWVLSEADGNVYVKASEFASRNGLVLITGHTFDNDINFLVQELERNAIKSAFMSTPSLSSSTNFVFFENTQTNDLYVDIKIERSYEFIDTLKVKNITQGSWPQQESKTGVVFGKLEAVQKIFDDYDNRIKIPLKNVPIGIFNPSESFPSVMSVDSQGDRLKTYFSGAATEEQYFNKESFAYDIQFMQSETMFSAIPAQYKFVTLTNDEGEFIIHDVPIGPQTIFFEVDLLAQGLTKDEVELNFFRYPTTERPNIDSVPHFFFRQFQVDVVPSWGYTNTGYTQLNIAADIDLRKWITYFVPPIAYQLKTIEEMAGLGYDSPLVVDVKDMSVYPYKSKGLSMVQIDDIKFRDPNFLLTWENEFSSIKNNLQFRKNGYSAFKLPANIYDQFGYKTDGSGFTTSNKGVWLGAYQTRMYYKDKKINRTTGSDAQWNYQTGTISATTHFDLNKYGETGLTHDIYSRRWTATFPNQYSIPSIPVKKNTGKSFDYLGRSTVLEQPFYTDGDMVGLSIDGNVTYNNNGDELEYGGFAAIYMDSYVGWQPNGFCKTVCGKKVYKYESKVYNGEEYSNGYCPQRLSDQIDFGTSAVKNGEQYQRLEAGYAYWLRPQRWPRVGIFGIDGKSGLCLPDVVHDATVAVASATVGVGAAVDPDGVTIARKASPVNITNFFYNRFDIGLNMGGAKDGQGCLDVFRIVDSSYNDLSILEPPFLDKGFKLAIKGFICVASGVKVNNLFRETVEDYLAVLNTSTAPLLPITPEANVDYYLNYGMRPTVAYDYSVYTNGGVIQITPFRIADNYMASDLDGDDVNETPETIFMYGMPMFPVDVFGEVIISITNVGEASSIVEANSGTSVSYPIEVNQTIEITGKFREMELVFHANSEYDLSKNSYEKAKYKVLFNNNRNEISVQNSNQLLHLTVDSARKDDVPLYNIDEAVSPTNNMSKNYLRTKLNGQIAYPGDPTGIVVPPDGIVTEYPDAPKLGTTNMQWNELNGGKTVASVVFFYIGGDLNTRKGNYFASDSSTFDHVASLSDMTQTPATIVETPPTQSFNCLPFQIES